ncbi:MAG: UvrD-helicase domain-containing protein [Bacteroidales bacterium]
MPFILYRSSAGSGKTFTLVREYLKIVLQKPDEFRHILAITFTNKAAQEMKDRILKYLRQLSDPQTYTNNPIVSTLLEETSLDTVLLNKRAVQVLQLILHNYSDFSVTTIDSFMHRVIRTFAHDLHLPMDFEVELDNELLVKQAVNNLIRQVGNDAELTNALVDLILNKSDEERGWHIESDLENIGNQLFKESGQISMERFQKDPLDIQTARELSSALRKSCREFEKNLSEFGNQAIEIISAKNIPFAAFYQGLKGLPKYFSYLASSTMDKVEPGKFTLTTIEEDKWYSGSATPGDKAAIDSIKTQLLDIYEKIDAYREAEYSNYISYKILEKNILPLAVLSLIDRELRKIKIDNNILPIGEFNKRISDTVLNEPVPFIYERLGEWYHYYLLDEFQDTSILQWLNLLPLVENSLSGNYTTIIVGDGKQAIYRWRNGDVEQFSRLPEVYLPMDQDIPEGRKLILARNYQEDILEKNYRTASDIVEFNNDFFTVLTSFLHPDHQPIYSSVIQKTSKTHSSGFVSLELSGGEDDDLAMNDAHLQRVVEIIRACCEDGYEWRDIAVLCRSNANASLVSRFLLNENISVSSSESILLRNSPRVNVLIACLYSINNPEDKIHREVVQRYFLASNREISEIEHITSAYNRGIPVYELSEKLVRGLSLDKNPDPFIIFFLDTVLQYTQKQDVSITGFLNWWVENEYKVSLKTPEDFNAVKVLTIHKAKGLEFEIVIYPFALEPRKIGGSAWVPVNLSAAFKLKTALVPLNKSLEGSVFSEYYNTEDKKVKLDFLNVLYVAMTRPKDRLYILSCTPSKEYSKANRTSDLFGIYLNSIGIDPLSATVYSRGVTSKKETSHKQEQRVFSFTTMHSMDWTERISIRSNHPDDWDVDNPDKPRSVGNIVHNILAGIRTFSDLDLWLSEFSESHSTDDPQAVAVGQFLDRLRRDESILPFFSPDAHIRNEAEILTPEGQSYRPDRLVISPDKTLILDYKTGLPDEHHKIQLQHYGKLLQSMGYPAVETYLYYLDGTTGLLKVC